MSQDTWKDVKSRIEGLGLKFKLHLERGQEDDTEEGTDPDKAKAAFEELGEKLQEAFAGFGKAAKDPAIRTDVKEIGLLLKDAIQETMSNVGAEVGDRIKKPGTSAQDTADDTVEDTVDDTVKETTDEAADDPADSADDSTGEQD